jgi:hypothetical protein
MPNPNLTTETDRSLRSGAQAQQPPTMNDLSAALIRLEQQMVTLNLNQASMSKSLDEKVMQLNTTIDEKLDLLRTDLHDELLGKILHNESKIEAQSNRIDLLESKIEDMANQMELKDKSTDVIVRGIPMLKDENLQTYYKQMASAIGFEPENLPRIRAFRLGRKMANTKFDPPILFKFPSSWDKSDFFSKYLAERKLNLSDIGFQAGTRIYLSENLTSNNQFILRAAQKLRTEKKIFAVKSKFGAVFISHKEGDREVVVRRLSDLPA